jgi:flagellar motor component MotA
MRIAKRKIPLLEAGISFFMAYVMAGAVSSKIYHDCQKRIRINDVGLSPLEKIPEGERPKFIRESISDMREDREKAKACQNKYSSWIFTPFYCRGN